MSNRDTFAKGFGQLDYTGSKNGGLKHGDLIAEGDGMAWVKQNRSQLIELIQQNGGELRLHDNAGSSTNKTTTFNLKLVDDKLKVECCGEILQDDLKVHFKR
jgi:hypothetical protein